MMLLVYGVDNNPAPVDSVHVAELRVLLDTHPALEDVGEWVNLLVDFLHLGPTVLNYETILYATYF